MDREQALKIIAGLVQGFYENGTVAVTPKGFEGLKAAYNVLKTEKVTAEKTTPKTDTKVDKKTDTKTEPKNR